MKVRVELQDSSVDLNDRAGREQILKEASLQNPPWNINSFIDPGQMYYRLWHHKITMKKTSECKKLQSQLFYNAKQPNNGKKSYNNVDYFNYFWQIILPGIANVDLQFFIWDQET